MQIVDMLSDRPKTAMCAPISNFFWHHKLTLLAVVVAEIDKIYMWLCKVYIATQLKLIRNNP